MRKKSDFDKLSQYFVIIIVVLKVFWYIFSSYDSLSQPPSDNEDDPKPKTLYNWPEEIRHQVKFD